MIARTWRGATRASDADAYSRYMEETGLRDFAATPGNLGALLLRRATSEADGPGTEFLVISLWESRDAVERFAGPEIERAVFYPEDERFLVRRDLTVDHLDVVALRGAPLAGAVARSTAESAETRDASNESPRSRWLRVPVEWVARLARVVLIALPFGRATAG